LFHISPLLSILLRVSLFILYSPQLTLLFRREGYYIRDEALGLQEAEISKLHLLIYKENANVIAFMSLSTRCSAEY